MDGLYNYTHLTFVLIGKDHILDGWWSKIEVIQVLTTRSLSIRRPNSEIRGSDGGSSRRVLSGGESDVLWRCPTGGFI